MAEQIELDPQVDAVFERLEAEADEIVEAIATTLKAEIPFYERIPPELVAAGVRDDVAAALTGLRRGQTPDKYALDAAAQVGSDRAQQGVPIEALLQAFRVGGREIAARARLHVRDLAIDTETLFAAIDRALGWLDAVSTSAARGHREAELTRLRADMHHRTAFLHGALHGSLSLTELRAQATAIGLDVDGRYAAVRASAPAGVPAHRLQAQIGESGDGARELIGIVDGDIAGIVARVPELPAQVTAGVGQAVPIERIAESYASASEALGIAIAFDRRGVHAMEELALEAATLDERIGGPLERRSLSALDALGERGLAIERTLRVFLDHGRRFDQTARDLGIHENTLRHRLGRYEEITGLDLRRVEDLVAIWIALEHRRVRRSRP